MNARSLEDHVRDHYAGKSLSPAALHRIRHAGDAERTRRQGWRRLVVLAAAAVLTLAAGWALLFSGDRAGAVAAEVVANHRKGSPLELTASRVEELAGLQARVGFLPVASRSPALAGLELVGGRRCSVGGRRAAQLRFQTRETTTASLYQVPLDEGLRQLPTGTRHVDGMAVEIWQEGGFFFALVKPAPR